jgi:hypothetical protein
MRHKIPAWNGIEQTLNSQFLQAENFESLLSGNFDAKKINRYFYASFFRAGITGTEVPHANSRLTNILCAIFDIHFPPI